MRTPAGIAVAPILEGKVVKTDVFNSVPESLRREVETKIAALEAEIEAMLAERPGAEKARRERLLALERAGRRAPGARRAGRAQDPSSARSPASKAIMKAAGRDLVRNAALFLGSGGHDSVKVPVGSIGDARFARYACTSWRRAAPRPARPSCRRPTRPTPTCSAASSSASGGEGHAAQVVRIKPGALHRANGGFLLLDGARAARRAGRSPKRCAARCEAEEIRFDPPSEPVGARPSEVPDLEPIPLNVKLVVLGDAEDAARARQELPAARAAVQGRGGVRGRRRALGRGTVAAYARLIAGIVAQNSLKPVDAGGVAMLIDEAARKAGGNGKLSLEVGHIADICREADHWAEARRAQR